MDIFKADYNNENIVYDEKYYKNLSKKLAEKSIYLFRKDLKEIFNK